MSSFLLVCLLLLQLGLSSEAKAARYSPVGQWDFTISGGNHQGNAFLEFFEDGTIDGFEIVGQVMPAGTNKITGAVTNLLGAAHVTGVWHTNSAGRLIGFLNEGFLLVNSASTNRTNAVSFVGTAGRGRLTLSGFTANGSFFYRGMTSSVITAVEGDFYANAYRGPLRSIDFLTLTPNALYPNTFDVQGTAPGSLSFVGAAQVSRRGRGSLLFGFLGANGTVTNIFSTTGTVNLRTGRWNTSGIDSSGAKILIQSHRQ